MQGHPMILWWSVVCSFSVLAGGVLCSVLPVEAKVDYEIINTGIKGGGCWYDDSHFIVVKGKQPAPGQEFEVEGLYYLDPNQPKDLKRIDLSPLEPSLQRKIRDVTCQGDTILLSVMASHRKTSRLYGVKIGQQPELIADLRWAKPAAVSLKGQYVVGNKLTVDKGVWEEQTDCDVRYLKPGFKALCWPRDTIGLWVAPQFVVHEYLWRETVWVRGQDGNKKRVPNPKPPIKLVDGREFRQGYLLRDLENQIVREIPMREKDYQYDTIHLTLDPQGNYVYCPCWKVGDHGDKQYTVGGRICRFRLDGVNQHWEEVVSVQQSPRDPFSLQGLDMSNQGDVVMVERGHRLVASLWKYSAQSKRVDKLLQVSFPDELGGPQISPSGRWVTVIRQRQLILIEQKGVTP